ncbi:MAG: hypothetical protein SGJ19_14975 [Planctomycetia bacterium]|nr:hypothetical protein [Planctomycetia bacterium]
MSRHVPIAAKRSSLVAIMACLGAMVPGCQPRGAADFVPNTDLARNAVEASLNAWSKGQAKVDPIRNAESSIGVELVDNFRAPGRELARFDILGETPATNARAFAVKLTLANPPEELKCRYLVVGIDPLWVFRQEDYDMLAHWDHAMPAESEKSATLEVIEEPEAAGQGP